MYRYLASILSPKQNSQAPCNDGSDDTDPQGHSDTVDDDFPALNDAHQMNDGNQGKDDNYDSANGFNGELRPAASLVCQPCHLGREA